MIDLDQVTLHRGNVAVLHSVSMHIPTGAITAIVGRSGVGKTTLISALNGLLKPSNGEIRVDGVGEINTAEHLQAYRKRTSTVFQNHALIDRLSALDNVLLGLADQRHPLSPRSWSVDFQERAARALAKVDLLDRAMTSVAQLSGGERQRVGVARALVREPAVLLGDEPFASVDPALFRHLGDTLRNQVAEAGLTVVLVMHQIEAALNMADKVIALAGGRVAFDGAPEAFDNAAQSAVFGNVQEMS